MQQRLTVTEHEIALRFQSVIERLYDAPPRSLIEVYQHIATEDRINTTNHRDACVV